MSNLLVPRRILFITSTRIGDAVFSSGLLDYLVRSYPDHKITIVCGPLCASLFEGVPTLERIIALNKEKWNRHWWKLWKLVVPLRWDIVVDLRNSLVSRLVRANHVYSHGSHIDKTLPKPAQNAQIMGLSEIPLPRLYLSKSQQERARFLVPDGAPVLGIGPTSNWIGKTWPIDRYKDVAARLLGEGGLCEGWRLAVFAAPGEEKEAYALLNSVPEVQRIDVIAKGTPGEAAAALARCNLFLGNDSGLTHCAAAVGVPTLGLYGPSFPDIYAPSGLRAHHVRTPESSAELINFSGYDPKTLKHNLMESLSVEEVLRGVAELMQRP
jgi:heptosyltransferase-3